MQRPTVVAVIDDLFFQAKVRTALHHLGLAVDVVPDGGRLHARLQGDGAPDLVIVDLTLRSGDAVALIRDLRAASRGRSVPVLAFGSHVAVEVQKQALQAGANQVVAKSAFARRLPQLVRQFVPAGDESDPASASPEGGRDEAC